MPCWTSVFKSYSVQSCSKNAYSGCVIQIPSLKSPRRLHVFEFFTHCDIVEFMITQRKSGGRIWKEYRVGQRNKTPCEWSERQWVLHVHAGLWRRPTLQVILYGVQGELHLGWWESLASIIWSLLLPMPWREARGQDQDWMDYHFILHRAGLGSPTIPCPYIPFVEELKDWMLVVILHCKLRHW